MPTATPRNEAGPFDGLLIIDKPSGPTSSDVVQTVKRLLRAGKVGHTGTLDPLATGVLPLCLGKATRLSQYLLDADKGYRATLVLGARTDTGDAEGRVIEERPVPPLTAERVDAALVSLTGEQLQRPPMYSAVKVGGERLYERARRGESVERSARPIRIDRLTLLELAPPRLVVDVLCSKGTYVRVLGEAIGERLGTVAHLAGLRRTRSGAFAETEALGLAELEAAQDPRELALQRLLPAERALGHLRRIDLDAREAEGVRHGRAPSRPEGLAAGLLALHDPAGKLVAVGKADGVGRIGLERVLTGI
ncbi:MAG TPA: tRNA pseudouridine(55) synthase TruB [Myxococcales bacterium]|nr:tRNA pseudouridine(55) synthase TruB [Myxococcales bacterium]